MKLPVNFLVYTVQRFLPRMEIGIINVPFTMRILQRHVNELLVFEVCIFVDVMQTVDFLENALTPLICFQLFYYASVTVIDSGLPNRQAELTTGPLTDRHTHLEIFARLQHRVLQPRHIATHLVVRIDHKNGVTTPLRRVLQLLSACIDGGGQLWEWVRVVSHRRAVACKQTVVFRVQSIEDYVIHLQWSQLYICLRANSRQECIFVKCPLRVDDMNWWALFVLWLKDTILRFSYFAHSDLTYFVIHVFIKGAFSLPNGRLAPILQVGHRIRCERESTIFLVIVRVCFRNCFVVTHVSD